MTGFITSLDGTQQEPLLGLATTRELIDELHARMTITADRTVMTRAFAYVLEYALTDLDAKTLDYRTVDGDV